MNPQVVTLLNLVTGASPQAAEFWSDSVHSTLCGLFGSTGVTSEEAKDLLSAVWSKLSVIVR